MAEDDRLSFADGPRLDLDHAITTLLAQAERVMTTQGRLRSLLRATQAIVEQIDLPTVLRRIVEAAVDLAKAQYGAMGVIAPEGDALEQFIVVGLDANQTARIGHLPQGRGLLGAVIDDPRPIRLANLAADTRAVGFPPHHPEMSSFLGVPVRVRGVVFGNLYLTNHRDGEFTEEDEQLVMALASTAGFAIENARLFSETVQREKWMAAAAELSASLLTTPPDTALDLLASRMLDVADAGQVTVLLAGGPDSQPRVAAVRGERESLRGKTIDTSHVFARSVFEDSEPRAVSAAPVTAQTDPLLVTCDGTTGPAMAVPLRSQTRLWGVLSIARESNCPRFTAAELESATDMASRASIALELARAREEHQRALLADDRRRIARDLHDHVIQQLFATGLVLQGVSRTLAPGPDNERVSDAIEQLNDAISQIRTVVFALSHRDEASARHRLIDIVAELSAFTRRPPAVRFSGPVDHVLIDDLGAEVVGVARELLSNAVRHARADRLSLDVSVLDGSISVVVEDDGVGIPDDAPRSGLDNLTEKAQQRGGTFIISSSKSGTSAQWRVPVMDEPSGTEQGGLSA